MSIIAKHKRVRDLERLSPRQRTTIEVVEAVSGSLPGKGVSRRRATVVEAIFALVLNEGGMLKTTFRLRENMSTPYLITALTFCHSSLIRKLWGSPNLV